MEQKTNPEFRQSGILVHPTSFPGPYGIGDLGKGAYDFIDFLQAGGQTLWQCLPLGPTVFLRLCRPASDHQPGKAHGLRAADGGRCRLPSGME